MKITPKIIHFLLVLAMVFLPLQGVMAGLSDAHSEDVDSISIQSATQSAFQVVHVDEAEQNNDKQPSDYASLQKINLSTDCHEHSDVDCATCAFSFTLNGSSSVGRISPIQHLYIDYSASVMTLFLPRDIRPPIS